MGEGQCQADLQGRQTRFYNRISKSFSVSVSLSLLLCQMISSQTDFVVINVFCVILF